MNNTTRKRSGGVASFTWRVARHVGYNPSDMMPGMHHIFGPDGPLAKHHPHYEYRAGQIKMAEAVWEAIHEGGHLCVEAGTGTGKTLAYLIPALDAHERVIISTGTKNLQEQLYYKDIPFLEKALGRRLRVTYMKGRANYVCLYRLKKQARAPVLEKLEDVDYFEAVRSWALQSETGDRAELTDLPENLSFWSHIDARSEICLGRECPEYEECFITRMRQRAEDSDIVIVNHHLFFADVVLRGNDYGAVIPDYSIAIFDEAHLLEDIASEYFGHQVSPYRLTDLIADVQRALITDADKASDIFKICARLKQRADRFWMHFIVAENASPRKSGTMPSSNEETRCVLEPGFIWRERTEPEERTTLFHSGEAPGSSLTPAGKHLVELLNTLTLLETTLASIKDPPQEIKRLVQRTGEIYKDLEFIMSCSRPDYVYWYERRHRHVFLRATPIDVSDILAEYVFDRLPTVILTSATLASDQSFRFIRSRLGIREARELIVPSHFDFQRQVILYLPPHMPDPRHPAFLDCAVEEIANILHITAGRAFVLFTSIHQMNAAYERVSRQVPFPCLVQGQGSKSGLLETFKRTPHAVLFATSSFWQGVDVQGEALSCVIIDRLPFAVPTDPVIAARQRYIEERGGNAFYEYSVPQAVLMLKQGLGRLIRSKDDVGVLSVLDPRLRTKAYGQVFLRSLPPCPITDNLTEIGRVFERGTTAR